MLSNTPKVRVTLVNSPENSGACSLHKPSQQLTRETQPKGLDKTKKVIDENVACSTQPE